MNLIGRRPSEDGLEQDEEDGEGDAVPVQEVDVLLVVHRSNVSMASMLSGQNLNPI